MPSLRALECLIAVADTGSITQAALLLHSSQPAVSHQIASLEREARTALLRREARGSGSPPRGGSPSPTPGGRSRRPPPPFGRPGQRRSRGGLLRIACAQSLTVPLLAPVLRDWRRHHPNVAITLHELAVMDEALRLVESDDVDVAVLPDPRPTVSRSPPSPRRRSSWPRPPATHWPSGPPCGSRTSMVRRSCTTRRTTASARGSTDPSPGPGSGRRRSCGPPSPLRHLNSPPSDWGSRSVR